MGIVYLENTATNKIEKYSATEALEKLNKFNTYRVVKPQDKIDIDTSEKKVEKEEEKGTRKTLIFRKVERSPDYVETTEKEMKKFVPLIKLFGYGLFKMRPIVRKCQA